MEWTATILDTQDFIVEGKIADRILTLATPQDFSFQAGQFVMIAHESVKNMSNPSQLRWGSMSIASSSEKKDSLELVISVGSPEGITFFVANNLKKGGSLLVRGPFGVFSIKEPYDELAFVAAGTGIAPLLSMIRSKLDMGEKKPVSLYFGFKTQAHFLYRRELEALQQKHPNFHFYYIMSREPLQNGKQGYVQELLKEKKWELKKNTQFYLCGPPVAVTAVREAIKAIGFSEKHVHFEQWG